MPKGKMAKLAKRNHKHSTKLNRNECGQFHGGKRDQVVMGLVGACMTAHGYENISRLKEVIEEVVLLMNTNSTEDGSGRIVITKEVVRDIVARAVPMRWGKDAVNTAADCEGAFHMWIEDEEGNIHDPHFQEYENLCFIWKTDPHAKVYEEWTPEQQKEKLRNMLPRVMKQFQFETSMNTRTGVKTERKRTPTEYAENVAFYGAEGRFLQCPMNAVGRKRLNPTWTIKVGNMGFRSIEDPERVFWEY